MMHHPNMHHQAMSGHPPQHMGGHQTMPTHHQMPPHQLHRENRHVTLTRVPLGPSQPGGAMSVHGQAMGAMGVPPHHGPTQRPPHPIRAMPHHPPGQHHNVPPQQMKPLRRPFVAGGYGPGSSGVPAPFPQHRHHQPTQSTQSGQPTPSQHTRLCRSSSPSIFSTSTKLGSDFAVSTTLNMVTTNTSSTNIPEASANASAGVCVSANASVSASASEGSGSNATAGDGEAARPTAAQANSKEKTPMCLVNELARYNKIKHQYRLTSETGPAHKKVFTVTLRLGDTEEYTAEGSSIKRAQHAAASSALSGTGYPPPPPRALSQHPATHPHHRHSVMPTVELNALAMKLCQPAVYTSIPAVASGRGGGGGGARGFRGGFLPPAYPRMMPAGAALVYRVRVAVGGRAWLGEGPTPQAARHDAAARALRDLRPPPDPRASHSPHASPHTDPPPTDLDAGEADLLNSEVKSPVSLVHELALKRNLSVQFTVKSERGPPHMRVFVTLCTVGDLEAEGEGNGKKVSKRRGAERMLDEMRRRWPPAMLRTRSATDPRRRTHPSKKKPRNLVKEGGEAGVAGGGSNGAGVNGSSENPISRLAVARHAARARSPQYRVVEERGAARRREFLVQCDAPPHSATGLGPNKKIAKRRAAQNVLLSMEKGTSSNDPTTPTNTNSDANSATATDSNKPNSTDTKQKENDSDGGEVRQPVPGVLLMDYHQRTHPIQHNGVSETNASGGNTPGAKDQLMYLSQLLGFTVQFSDFPKRNHGEYLSLVSLSTEPPVMCHGGGPSTAHSHEQCSRAALRALAHMGLDPPASAPPAPHTVTQPAAPGIQNISGSGTKSIISNGITE